MQAHSRQSMDTGYPGSLIVVLWPVHEVLLSPFITIIARTDVEMDAL